MDRPRVLVVDDDPLQLELMQRALAHDGFTVAVGSSLDDVRHLAKDFAPDVVLMDVHIAGAPDGSGLPVARAVAPAGTRVYFFSACDESELRALARDLKADGWLSKSLPVADVSRRLKEMVGRGA
jgi:two-component system OmpR family response regulator